MDIKKDINQNSPDIEINLLYVFNLIRRNKRFITYLSLISLLIPVFTNNFSKKTWQGQFEIVIRKDKSVLSDSMVLGNDFASKLIGFNQLPTSINTEFEILKSSSVLMPVFEFVKNQNNKGRPIALFRPTRGTELSRGFNDFNDFNETKTPKIHKTPDLSPPTHGIKVQRLQANGEWQNGWVIANCSDPSDITISRMGSPHLTAEHYRWQINLKPTT